MWSRGGFRGVLGATETTVLKNHLAECYTYSVRRARGDDFWILAEFPTASTQRNWRSSFGKRRQPRVNLSLENCRRYRVIGCDPAGPEEYLVNVREVEGRIQKTEKHSGLWVAVTFP